MITSHTLVRNGMPFIGKVLRAAQPFVDEMIITISEKSNDGTWEEIQRVRKDFPDKIRIDVEDVKDPGELTQIENRMLQKSRGDWIFFLSDDDYWTPDQLKLCIGELDKDPNILAYSVNPYQLIDWEHYDYSWRHKYFTKFFRRGSKYINPWPKDLIADKTGRPLYHRTHEQVKNLPYKFYHLSYMKGWSFRNEEWAKEFRHKVGEARKLEQPLNVV
jgi:glycosyltransferase involved in cell wall biosynthesis